MTTDGTFSGGPAAESGAFVVMTQIRERVSGLLTLLRAGSMPADPVGVGSGESDNAADGLTAALALVPTAELTGVFADLVALQALAEGASAAVLVEAASRGVVEEWDDSPRPLGPKVTRWVHEVAAAAGAPVTTGLARTYRQCWEDSRRAELEPLTAAVRGGRVPLAVAARLVLICGCCPRPSPRTGGRPRRRC